MVCFNSECTIENSIVSVLNQSYKDIEFIVVDGYSVDNSLNIINKYKGNIHHFISEQDFGLYDAMNKGIFLAKGDLIGILNSDDIFNSDNVVENIVKFHNNYDIDASVGDIIQVNKNDVVLRYYSAKYWRPLLLKIGFMPPHPSIFIKKSIFNKYGNYDISFKIASDYELITRFFLRNKISWKYSGIITTKMLFGGISSSGISSYKTISFEIKKSLYLNHISFYSLLIDLRFIWKVFQKIFK